MKRKQRIATVKATGDRYMVDRLDFEQNLVRCWGEVSEAWTDRTGHQGKKKFPMDEVEVSEVEITSELKKELFAQYVRSLKREGYIIGRKGPRSKKLKIFGRRSPREVELANELGIDLATASPSDIATIREIAQDEPERVDDSSDIDFGLLKETAQEFDLVG